MHMIRLSAVSLSFLSAPGSTTENELPTLFDNHEPSQGSWFGSINPSAPTQTEQFDFMVGEFRCVDELLQADGTWKSSKGQWRAAYLINGQAIIDQYWNEQYAGMSVRHYDEAIDKWRVYFVGAPPTYSGEWTGTKDVESGNMIMLQERPQPDGKMIFSRLTFFEIKPDGFNWVGERVADDKATPNWKIDCKRLR